MNKKKINILFIGAGNIAKKHLEVLSSLVNLNNSWIYSRTDKKSKKLAKQYSLKLITENYYNFIIKNKNKIDGIFLLSSLDQIYSLSKILLKFKIPLFIEKPPGLNISQLKELNKLSINYRTSNLVGYNRRYYSVIQKLKKKIKAEKVISAHVESHERYWLIKKIVKNKKTLNNWTYANSSHVITLLNYLLGEHKSVITKSNNIFKYPNIKVNTSSLIEFKNKIFVTFKANWDVVGGWSIKIYTNKNTYTLNPLETCSVINKNFKIHKIKPEKYDFAFKSGFYLQSKLFLRILNNKKYFNDLNNIVSSYKLIKKIYGK